jgi:predicted kinase
MCGLPFSGKSYTGKKIAELTGAEFLSYDILWQAIKDFTGVDLGWEELSAEAHKRIKKVLESGNSIVYDTLNDTVHNRDVLRNIAKECKSEAFVVYMDTPLEIISQRRKENLINKERHSVADTNFRDAQQRFEPPYHEDNVIIITPETNLKDHF